VGVIALVVLTLGSGLGACLALVFARQSGERLVLFGLVICFAMFGFCFYLSTYKLGASHERMSADLAQVAFALIIGGIVGDAISLASLLGSVGLLAGERPRAEFDGALHHRAKAKRVVQLFMSGAASQCDTFDYKPALIKRHGENFDPGGKVELFQSVPGALMT